MVPAFQHIVLRKIVTVVLRQLRARGPRLLAISTNRVLVMGHYGQSEFVSFCSSWYRLRIGVSIGSFLL